MVRRVAALAVLVASTFVAPHAAAQAWVDALLASDVSPAVGWEAQQRDWERRLPPGERPGPHGEPGPDAPLDVLALWWTAAAERRPSDGPPWPSPTPAVRQRLVEAYLGEARNRSELLTYLPDDDATCEALERYLDANGQAPNADAAWSPTLRNWLLHHGRRHRAELRAAAAAARFDGATMVGRDAIDALARSDDAEAEPVLRRLVSDAEPRLRAVALAALLTRATAVGDAERAAALEAELRSIVADRTATGLARAVSFEAVIRRGAPDVLTWYAACFRDPTLHAFVDELALRPLAEPVLSDPDRWACVPIGLVDDADPAVRDAARRSLRPLLSRPGGPHAGVVRSLLRYLAAPSPLGGYRWSVVIALGHTNVTEAVPGLLALAKTTQGSELADVALALARHDGPQIAAAIRDALVRLGDEPTHVVTYRMLVEKGTAPDRARIAVRADIEAHRRQVIAAWLAHGGPNDDDAVAALVAYSREAPHADANDRIVPLEAAIGAMLVGRAGRSGDLGERLADAAAQLEATEHAARERLLAAADAAPGRRRDHATLGSIADGTVDAPRVAAALADREALRTRAGDDLAALARIGGTPAGVAAALQDDARVHGDMLAGTDVEAQRALLACARVAGIALPVSAVARLHRSGDARLAHAAERYLQDADGDLAVPALIERPPATVRLRAARAPVDALARWADGLVAELDADPGLEETFAIMSWASWGMDDRVVVRVRAGRATVSEVGSVIELGSGESVRVDEPLRFTGELPAPELAGLQRFVRGYAMDDLASTDKGGGQGLHYHYVHLTRQRGRSVYMSHHAVASAAGSRCDLLMHRLRTIVARADMRLRFAVEDHVPGVKVLKLGAVAVDGIAAEGDELRVRVAGGNTPPEWRRLGPDGLSDERPAPAVIPDAEWGADLPAGMWSPPRYPWQLRVGAACLRGAGDDRQSGLWLCRAGTAPERVAAGKWGASITTPDGKWAVAARETESGSWAAVRVELDTRACMPIELAAAAHCEPVAYVAAHGRVLVVRARAVAHSRAGGRWLVEPEHYLVDPATGACERVVGELRPWSDLGSRPLQPTGRPDEVWAVIREARPTRTIIGRYDTRRFAFTPVAAFPSIELSSMDVWVDRDAAFAHAVASWHVLRLPLR